MGEVVLSIIIPTYNRPELVHKILTHIIQFQSEELEIVVCDDNPLSNITQEVVSQIKDPRIKYYRNKKNLGYDLNMLICVKRASGDFIFLLCDDDDIEISSIPWILKTIKSNKNLSQLCGTIGNHSSGHKLFYAKFRNKYLKRGFESLKELLFYYSHGCGIVLRKSVLNLKRASKYNGFLYTQQVLIAQALIAGDTLCTSKFFGYAGKFNTTERSDQPLISGRGYWHPLSKLETMKYRLAIIFDITEGMKNSEYIRNFLLFRERVRIYRFLNETLLISLKSFLEGINITGTIRKNFKFSRFWTELLIYLVHSFCHRKLNKFHKGFFNYFIYQVTKFLDLVKSSFIRRH